MVTLRQGWDRPPCVRTVFLNAAQLSADEPVHEKKNESKQAFIINRRDEFQSF